MKSSPIPRLLFGIVLLGCAVSGQPLAPGKNSVVLRGHAQDVHYYPAASGRKGALLFLPGDGGWRGFAIDIANGASSYGYDVFGWDTKGYLEGFTPGKPTLTVSDVIADFRAMAGMLTRGKPEKLVVGGWSEGAGLALLGAAAAENRGAFRGLLAIGLPARGFLGWRLADNITYVTKRDPAEPHFDSAPLLPKVSPLALAMIHSSGDEYVKPDLARQMFDAASQPKRFFLVEARDHRYDGNQGDFFRALRQALEWMRESQ
jgi:pimeloyl-ACP methyl ester carboxylesterase